MRLLLGDHSELYSPFNATGVYDRNAYTQIRGSLSAFASGNSLELYNRKYNIIGLNEPILVKGAGLHAGSRRTKPGETGWSGSPDWFYILWSFANLPDQFIHINTSSRIYRLVRPTTINGNRLSTTQCRCLATTFTQIKWHKNENGQIMLHFILELSAIFKLIFWLYIGSHTLSLNTAR